MVTDPAEHTPGHWARREPKLWADIWDVVGPQMQTVVDTGDGFAVYDQLLRMERGGRARDT